MLSLILYVVTTSIKAKANAPADPDATIQAITLFNRLSKLSDIGVMYGHQDDLVYGYTWKYEEGRSDIKDIVGDYPAVVGFELGHIELGKSQSLDDVDFKQIHDQIVKFNKENGIITLTWHLDNPATGGDAWDVSSKEVVKSILPNGQKHDVFNERIGLLADFLLSLKDDDGQLIPFIFRPYHEHSGNFFWWGNGICTTEEYISLWQYTVKFLRDKGLHNILYAYNTDRVTSLSQYTQGYPGDDYIDILTIDMYDRGSSYFQELDQALGFVSEHASSLGKIAALSECGGSASNWFDGQLLPVLKKHKISWVLTWRHPYQTTPANPGITNQQHDDFKTFYQDSATLFLNEIREVK